jgi:putative membrane protein
MRRRITFSFFIGFLAVSLFGCNSNNSSDATSPNREQPNMNNRSANSMTSNSMNSNTMSSTTGTNTSSNTAVMQDNFWTKAAQGGMAEVELAKLALQKSQNADVKKFAQMMVTDHTKANTELKALAAKKSVVLPTDIGSHKSTMDDLNGKTGADFDKAYVEAMVDDHETDVDLFEDNTDNSDADIKAFATKTLPTLQSHLKMIKDIQSKMK